MLPQMLISVALPLATLASASFEKALEKLPSSIKVSDMVKYLVNQNDLTEFPQLDDADLELLAKKVQTMTVVWDISAKDEADVSNVLLPLLILF